MNTTYITRIELDLTCRDCNETTEVIITHENMDLADIPNAIIQDADEFDDGLCPDCARAAAKEDAEQADISHHRDLS